MKILIVKISALGDVVHALPAALYLRNLLPHAQIDWLVEETFGPLLDPLPYIDHVIPVNTRLLRKKLSFRELMRMGRIVRQVRHARYDYVFDLQGNFKSGFYTLCSGAPHRFGFDREAVREWPNLLATNRKVALGCSLVHVTERALGVVREAFPGGVSPDFGHCLLPDREAEGKVADWLAGFGIDSEKIIVCHIGTTWKTKLWAPERWEELLRRLSCHQGLRFVLTWGDGREREQVTALGQKIGKTVLPWPGGDIRRLVALLKRADLVIGGDTGPVHIAAALGTATVSIFRATDVRRNGPRGENHIGLQTPLHCSPCLMKDCDKDPECSREISVATVEKAVAKLLAGGLESF